LTDQSCVTVGEKCRVVEESTYVRLLARFFEPFLYFFFTKVGKVSAVHDVFSDGATEENRFLLDDGQLFLVVPFVVNLFKISLIVKQFSLDRIIKSFDQADD